MEKTITIGNREITMKATANTPKRYRNEFNKDLLIELQNLFNHLDKKTGEFVGQVDLSLVENLAYIITWALRGNHLGPQGKSRGPHGEITWAPRGNHKVCKCCTQLLILLETEFTNAEYK